MPLLQGKISQVHRKRNMPNMRDLMRLLVDGQLCRLTAFFYDSSLQRSFCLFGFKTLCPEIVTAAVITVALPSGLMHNHTNKGTS